MLSKRGQIAWLIILAFLLLDSMTSYFIRNVLGLNLRVNAAIPAFMFIAILSWGARPVIPNFYALVSFLMLSLAFASGLLFIEGLTLRRGATLASSMAAFLVGYAVARNTESEDRFAWVLLIIGLMYVMVCIVALSKYMPSFFPLINAYGFRNGELVIRPEVTIDQNFQIFYLFFIATLFLLPARLIRFTLVFLGSIGAAYVVARLQTRSGVLLFLGAMTMAWLAQLWTKGFGWLKILLLPLLLIGLAIVKHDWILRAAEGVITRFTDPEYNRTFYGRLYAIQFLFEKLLDPNFWVPQGNVAFGGSAKSIPHSNPTAVYLEAGLLGIIAWFMLVVVPLFQIAWLFLKRKLDILETILFISGTVVLIAQLSLNTPLFEQVWLWAGAVIGGLNRARMRLAEGIRASNDKKSQNLIAEPIRQTTEL